MEPCLQSLGITSPTSALFMGRKRALVLNTNSNNMRSAPQRPSLPPPPPHYVSSPNSLLRNGRGRGRLVRHRDSLELVSKEDMATASRTIREQQRRANAKNGGASTEIDDDTCSTATDRSTYSHSSLENDLDADCNLPASKHVRWAADIVSEVRFRPYTKRDERYHLFYNGFDYMDFKYDLMTGRQRSRKVVSFSLCNDQVIHIPSPTRKERRRLYYTESELQDFLDDFVLSLNDTNE